MSVQWLIIARVKLRVWEYERDMPGRGVVCKNWFKRSKLERERVAACLSITWLCVA